MSPAEYRPARGFIFWSLVPVLILFVIAMPLLAPVRTAIAVVTLVVVELMAILMLMGLFNPIRFFWAWRALGAMVFLVYCAYLLAMLIESGGKIEIVPRRGQASGFNAILGLVAFGLPGLWFALFGRLTFREESSSPLGSLDDDFDEDDFED